MKIPSKHEKRLHSAFVFMVSRACHLYILHTLALEYPPMLVTPCLESEAAVNHTDRLRSAEVLESSDLFPNCTPWQGAMVSMHGSLLEPSRQGRIPFCVNYVPEHAFS